MKWFTLTLVVFSIVIQYGKAERFLKFQQLISSFFPFTGDSLFCFECQGASDTTCSMQNMERKKMRTLCPALNKEQEETDLRAICVHVYFKGNCKLTATL